MRLSFPKPFPLPFSEKSIGSEFPILPAPVELIPQKLHTAAIVKILNSLLAEPLREGDLDFLKDQSVSVDITDLNLRFALTLDESDKLAGRQWQEKDSLNLKGNLYEFLLLASRTEDADTLFFQRRLKMEGSTDLGLEVKNLLDGLDMETIPYHQQIDYLLKRTVRAYEKVF